MPKDTKTRLLDSAERAARRQGFDGFSFADLAEDVGIRKASVHHHFASKAHLSVALMTRYYDELRATCTDIDHAHAAGAARLNALIAHYRDALEGGESLCLCVSFSTSTESLSEETIAQMNRFRAMMIDWLKATFAQGAQDGTIANVSHPEREANALLPLLEGALLAARVARDTTRFDDALGCVRSRMPGLT